MVIPPLIEIWKKSFGNTSRGVSATLAAEGVTP